MKRDFGLLTMGMHGCDKHKKKKNESKGLENKTNWKQNNRRNFNNKITVAISYVLITDSGFEQLFFFNE